MTEVRALLMTDLVDSTGTTQRLGEVAAAQLWLAHDRLVRALLSSWRGLEIDKSDGFLLIFDQVADAAHFALAYQRGLAELPVAVASRVGLHVAPVVLRANPPADVLRGAKPVEVESWLAKAVAARVMTLAAGGQTLLSADAAAALGGAAAALGGAAAALGGARAFSCTGMATGGCRASPSPSSCSNWVRRARPPCRRPTWPSPTG